MSKIKLGNRPRYKRLNRRNNRNGKITNFHQQIRPLLTDKADTPTGFTMFSARCFQPRKESSKKYIRTQKDRLHDVSGLMFQSHKCEVISAYLLENSRLQQCQIQEHLGHIQRNYLLSQQFLKVLLQSLITQS